LKAQTEVACNTYRHAQAQYEIKKLTKSGSFVFGVDDKNVKKQYDVLTTYLTLIPENDQYFPSY
jgi:hypothetical protein